MRFECLLLSEEHEQVELLCVPASTDDVSVDRYLCQVFCILNERMKEILVSYEG